MRTLRRLGLFGTIAAILLLSASCRAGEQASQDKAGDLMATLRGFGQKHGMTDGEVYNLLKEAYLDSANQSKKGGVALIGKNTYVIVDDKRNGLAFGGLGGDTWWGKKSTQPEIVVIDGRRVISSLDGVDPSHLTIVIFTPAEVRYLDLSDNELARFQRRVGQ